MSKQGLKGPELLERYKAYKNKDKERKRVQRNGQALSPSEVARRKKLIRERVRNYKQRQKEKKAKNSFHDQDVSQAYQTPQVLGKTLGKVSSRVLSQSPRKQKAVVFKLAHASGFLRKKKCTRGSPSEVVRRKKLIRERVRKYKQRQKEKKAKNLSLIHI